MSLTKATTRADNGEGREEPRANREPQVASPDPRRGIGSDERMREIFELHSAAVYAFLLKVTFGQTQLAQDILQETMLRAWRRLDTLEDDQNLVRSWLFTVARRVAIDAARTRQARPQEVGNYDMVGLPGTDDPVDQMLSGVVLRRALARLSPQHRAVLVEVYLRSRKPAEAAVVLGIPEGTVKSRTFYALRILREALEESQ